MGLYNTHVVSQRSYYSEAHMYVQCMLRQGLVYTQAATSNSNPGSKLDIFSHILCKYSIMIIVVFPADKYHPCTIIQNNMCVYTHKQ